MVLLSPNLSGTNTRTKHQLSSMSAIPRFRTFRARGIPLDWDLDRFQSFLNNSDILAKSTAHSLAAEIHDRFQTATVTVLEKLQIPRIYLPLEEDGSRKPPIVLENDFLGITTLHVPRLEDHKIDVLGIHGLGGHAFESFRLRGDSHMWLRDAIPFDIPMARVMTYGYKSSLIGSESIKKLEDLATSLYNELLQLANTKTMRPIILLAHSFGGLVLKKTLILLSKSQRAKDAELFSKIHGIGFFGVPHHGMDTTSLLPLVQAKQSQYNPNRSLAEFCHIQNAEALGQLHKDFHLALCGQVQSEIVTFYETNKSPTLKRNEAGKLVASGPNTMLVSKQSATQCRSWESGPEHMCGIDRKHAELIKFRPHDIDYDKVIERMKKLVGPALTLGDHNITPSNDQATTISDEQSDNAVRDRNGGYSSSMQSQSRVWRVLDVPQHFDKKKLTTILRRHPKLQCSVNCGQENTADKEDNGAVVNTLTQDLRLYSTATVSFTNLPSQLESLRRGGQLILDIPTRAGASGSGVKRKRDRIQPRTTKLVIDCHFNGITVLHTPTADDHKMDIVALSGFGCHPFGSFVHKEDGNMWLQDNLPVDVPGARTLIYGYNSKLQNGASFSQLDDLASSFQVALCSILQSSNQKPIILIGHSLGGLLIQEACTRIAESDTGSDFIRCVKACLFFGVPNYGMEIESLIPMVTDQPNRSLVVSLNDINSQVLRFQKRRFSMVADKCQTDMYCFYETEQTPTAWKDSKGDYNMIGPLRCLVNTQSATSCLPPTASVDRQIAISKTHSNLVKFSYRDFEYEKVAFIIYGIFKRCMDRLGDNLLPGPAETTHTLGPDNESSDDNQMLTRASSKRRRIGNKE